MNDRWQPGKDDEVGRRRGMLTAGLLLVVIGAFFLVSEQVSFDFGRYGWPVFIIAPGLFLLAVGLAVPHEGGLGAAIPGGLLTSVGLVLAFQSAADAYASWAYAWALVAPGSVGATLILYGLLHRRWDLLDAGLRTAGVGLGLFVGFGLFFENIIGLDEGSQDSVLRNALPVMAVALGIMIVIANLLPRRLRVGRPASRAAAGTEPPASHPAG